MNRTRALLGASLAGAAALYGWNAATLPPLIGYDAPGHAGFLLTIAREGALPHPLGGWSTFHPPTYHAVAAGVWKLAEPLGAAQLGVALRWLGAAVWLAAGLVAASLVRRLGPEEAGSGVAIVAATLVWLVPANQFSAVMVGNEAFGAGLAAFALPFLVALQADPRDTRAAAFAGLFAGLALATKFTGFWVAGACAVPFLRRDLDRRGARALAVAAVVGLVIAGPVYLRNLVVAGTPLPMTRDLEPMRGAEAALVLRPRRVADYVWIDPGVVLRPSIYHVADAPGSYANKNPAMTRVWGQLYAGLWYDAMGHRVPIEAHRDGLYWGTLLLVLGFVPTGLVLAGLAAAVAAAVRSRGRSPDAPLVALSLLGLVSFVGFTAYAPSLAAAKASYLLPLAVPAAVFFAGGAGLLRARWRAPALGVSLAAALVAALVFAQGLVFDLERQPALPRTWLYLAEQLPGSHIAEAVQTFYGGEPRSAGGAPPSSGGP